MRAMSSVTGWLLFTVASSAFAVRTEGADTGNNTNRLCLEITVGECEASLRDRLPETTNKRLSPEDLAQHNPTAPILTQRLLLPAWGWLNQELKCAEFAIRLDLEYRFNAGLSAAVQKTNSVTGGVSSSYASGNGLLRQSHWNCFAVEIDRPLYMGYVKNEGIVYLIVGRFRIADHAEVNRETK